MIIALLVVINEMESRQFIQEKYAPEEGCVQQDYCYSERVFVFSLCPADSWLMPGATSKRSVLSFYSLDYK